MIKSFDHLVAGGIYSIDNRDGHFSASFQDRGIIFVRVINWTRIQTRIGLVVFRTLRIAIFDPRVFFEKSAEYMRQFLRTKSEKDLYSADILYYKPFLETEAEYFTKITTEEFVLRVLLGHSRYLN